MVYLPQITENYRLQSGEGLSLICLVTWMTGDICSLGGVLLGSWVPAVIWFWAYVRFFSVSDVQSWGLPTHSRIFSFIRLYQKKLLLSDLFLLAQVYYYRWKRSCYPIGPLSDFLAPTTNTPVFTSSEPGYERYIHQSESGCEYEYDEDDYLIHDLSSIRRRRRRTGISEKQETLLWAVLRSTLYLAAISMAGIIAWWIDKSYFGVVGSGGVSGGVTAKEGIGMRRVMEALTRLGPVPGDEPVSKKETWRNLVWSRRFVVVHAFGFTTPILQASFQLSNSRLDCYKLPFSGLWQVFPNRCVSSS